MRALIAAIAICIAVAFLAMFPPWGWLHWGHFDTYCGAGEDVSSCIREWSPSVIGLLALISSAVAVIYLVKQVREMRHQRQMLAEQLAYDRGDVEPELELLDNANAVHGGRFKIVNLSRRPIRICEIRWQAPQAYGTQLFIEDEQGMPIVEVTEDGKLKRWQTIEGWRERSSAPPEFVGAYSIGRTDAQDLTEQDRQVRVTLEVVGLHIGNRRRWVLTQWAPLGEVGW